MTVAVLPCETEAQRPAGRIEPIVTVGLRIRAAREGDLPSAPDENEPANAERPRG